VPPAEGKKENDKYIWTCVAGMPKIVRIDTPGLLHHIVSRGIERRKIFNDDKDRENFIEQLSVLLPETKTQCCVWSFLPNPNKPEKLEVESLQPFTA